MHTVRVCMDLKTECNAIHKIECSKIDCSAMHKSVIQALGRKNNFPNPLPALSPLSLPLKSRMFLLLTCFV